MERRKFLGTIAAFSAGTFISGRLYGQPLAKSEWYAETFQTLGHAPKFRAPVVTGVAINSSQSQIAVVGDDHYVSILDLKSRTFTQELRAHTDWVRVARFSPNGSSLVTAGNDRRAILWNTQDWTKPTEFAQQRDALINCAFTPDSKQITFVGFDGVLRTYSTESFELLRQLNCPCEDMRTVAYSHDGKLLAAAGRCGTIRIWDATNGQIATDITAHRQRVRSVEFDSKNNIISCSEDQFVRQFDSQNGSLKLELPRFASKLFAVELISDQLLATSGSDNKITLWNLESQTKTETLEGHTGTVSCLCSSPTILVSGSYDTQVRVWHRSSETGNVERHTQNQDGWSLKLK